MKTLLVCSQRESMTWLDVRTNEWKCSSMEMRSPLRTSNSTLTYTSRTKRTNNYPRLPKKKATGGKLFAAWVMVLSSRCHLSTLFVPQKEVLMWNTSRNRSLRRSSRKSQQKIRRSLTLSLIRSSQTCGFSWTVWLQIPPLTARQKRR
jgi:hypothetical protein